jgi:hypothetical protein
MSKNIYNGSRGDIGSRVEAEDRRQSEREESERRSTMASRLLRRKRGVKQTDPGPPPRSPSLCPRGRQLTQLNLTRGYLRSSE